MQTIKPTFGDLPEVPKESEQTSGSGLLTTVAVVGAGVVMAAAGYFFLGTGGKRKKKKKKKKKKGGNSGAARAKGGASAKAKKASQPLTAAAARKKNAAPAPLEEAPRPPHEPDPELVEETSLRSLRHGENSWLRFILRRLSEWLVATSSDQEPTGIGCGAYGRGFLRWGEGRKGA